MNFQDKVQGFQKFSVDILYRSTEQLLLVVFTTDVGVIVLVVL